MWSKNRLGFSVFGDFFAFSPPWKNSVIFFLWQRRINYYLPPLILHSYWYWYCTHWLLFWSFLEVSPYGYNLKIYFQCFNFNVLFEEKNDGECVWIFKWEKRIQFVVWFDFVHVSCLFCTRFISYDFIVFIFFGRIFSGIPILWPLKNSKSAAVDYFSGYFRLFPLILALIFVPQALPPPWIEPVLGTGTDWLHICTRLVFSPGVLYVSKDTPYLLICCLCRKCNQNMKVYFEIWVLYCVCFFFLDVEVIYPLFIVLFYCFISFFFYTLMILTLDLGGHCSRLIP